MELSDKQLLEIMNRTHRSIDKTAVFYDNVICTNCGYDGFVNVGDDKCPVCHEECLAWKENEPHEICW